MKDRRLIMGMPITVEVVDQAAQMTDIDSVFDYFAWVENTFSTFKPTSEISRINRGELQIDQASIEVQEICAKAEETTRLTDGYFNVITPAGQLDPAGIVKGWAIDRAAQLLRDHGWKNFCVDAGGDIQVAGMNATGTAWLAGIRNPFVHSEIVKIVSLHNCGMATSGTAARGQHIFNPHHPDQPLTDIVSLTVIGPNVYEADRFATAAFAMGRQGIYFIEQLAGFEGYMIDATGTATMTTGFEHYTPSV